MVLRATLRSEKGLAYAVSASHRTQRHFQFRPEFTRFMTPHMPSQELASKASGKAEFRGIRLPDSVTVERARHGVDNVAHEDSLEFVPAIDRRYKIEVVLVNRTQKPCHPIRFDVQRFGRNDGTRPGPQQLSRRQDGVQR